MAGLTEAKVRAAKPRETRYKIADGGGLYLEVRPNGTKSWLARIEKNGKRTWKTIGNVPIYTLDDARARMIEIRRGEVGLAPEKKPRITFRTVAAECCAKIEQGLSSLYSINNMYRKLEMHVYPLIGDKDISEITTKDMYAIAERMEALGIFPTAQKTMSLCSRIFRHGILKEYCTNDPTYALKGQLQRGVTQHRSALTDISDIGKLMRAMWSFDRPIMKQAMLLSAYTFCRPGEIRCARWDEFNIEREMWIIPAEKMKMKRDHVVPLTKQMISILDEMRVISGHSEWVFPSLINEAEPISKHTIVRGLRMMGYDHTEMTAHGFRGMASTILNEHGFNRDWIEMQLAHVSENQVRGAYNRAQYWEGRVEMIRWYNDYLDELRDKGVSDYGKGL